MAAKVKVVAAMGMVAVAMGVVAAVKAAAMGMVAIHNVGCSCNPHS